MIATPSVATSTDPTACETCATIARDLDRGETWECPFCGGVLERSNDRPRTPQRPPKAAVDPRTGAASSVVVAGTGEAHRGSVAGAVHGDRRPRAHDGLLSLLRDCALIARWDALASAPPAPLPVPPLKLPEAEADPTAVPSGGAPGGLRAERADARPGQGEPWVARACLLRDRLEGVWTRGRLGDTDAHHAAGVIEWLVPRARVLLDSAGEGRTPIQRDLPQQIGWAHVTERQREKWITAGLRVDGARRHGVTLIAVAVREWGWREPQELSLSAQIAAGLRSMRGRLTAD